MVVAALLVLLCIVSYHGEDEKAADLSFQQLVRALAGREAYHINNWLGVLGAIAAEFFVKNTFGYASAAFPLILGLWGWYLLGRKSIFGILPFTNYTLIFAVLFSVTLGTAEHLFGGIGDEFSGATGFMLSSALTNLFGSLGASIILLAVWCAAFIFAADIDVHTVLERLRLTVAGVAQRLPRRETPVTIQTHADEDMLPTQRIIRTVSHEEAEDVGDEITELSRAEPEELPITRMDIEPEEEPEDEEDFGRSMVSSGTEDDGVGEIDYVFPSVELLDVQRQGENVGEEELKGNAELLRAKLANFSVTIENVTVTPGPVVTLYELVPASDVKISRIVNLADDLALALAAKGIRIIAPIPGKGAVGVEIPNHHPSLVTIRSVINSARFRDSNLSLPLALGKTISGEVYVDDLSRMPHLLIAGATGSGKSIGINTIVTSLLYKLHPSDVKFVVIDPKKIELALYGKLRNHFLATSPDIQQDIITSPQNSVAILKSVELEMEKRYDRLASAGVRNIHDYNERVQGDRLKDTESVRHRKMPYIVVVIDELADLMMTAAREVEEPIARLAQLARAVGIHLVVATQRPSVDVITGVIKANFPARVAYQVSSKVDSRTILDMNGAEQLLGNGDMLYLPAGSAKPLRLQNAFISTDEVERIVDHVAKQQGYGRPFMLPSISERKKSGFGGGSGDRDELFEEAARLIVRHQQGSVSLLQRRLKVGYSRAARLVDELEAAGIVGPFDGSKAREVLVESEPDLDTLLKSLS